MRPVMKSTMCAFVAAAVAIPASPVFAKDVLRLLATVSPRAVEIEVDRVAWGSTRAKGKVEHEWKVEEGESAAPAPGGGAKFGAVSGAHRDDAPSGARSVTSPRDAASGQATGRRTHKPVTFTKEWGSATPQLARPLETGSMTLNVKLPGCAVGTRYPSAELTTSGGRYAFQDVVVASCGGASGGGAGGSLPTEQVTLNYAKVKVRAWDPQKKEH